MSEELKVFFSNRLEILYLRLREQLFSPLQSPFTRRLVVVYGPAMKSWLMMQMAQDPTLQIATGVEIVYLNHAFEHLIDLFQNGSYGSVPSQLELALAIECEIREKLNQFNTFSLEEQNDWLPLLLYLKIERSALSPLQLTRKMERRLIGLSHQLAQCFREYGRYGERLVERWHASHKQDEAWQKRLWSLVFKKSNRWQPCYKALYQPLKKLESCEVHFFSISFVAACEFNFLSRLSLHLPVCYYLLSPCAVFWSDIRSDRETSYLHTYWQRKLGMNAPQVANLEELLRDRNPLLANFGRLGREMAFYIEESAAQTIACYALPSHVQQLDEDLFTNEDLHLIKTNAPLTLLHAVQADILCMRNPHGRSPIAIDQADFSIQLHMAPNKRREVQILYNNLLRLIKETPSLHPSDMIVFVPNLADYIPYIQSQFGAQTSLIDYQILDLGLQAQSEIVQGFLQLLALSESRWDTVHLLQLFEHPSFQRRHQLSASDHTLIQQWIDKTGIRWGETLGHRNELLERHHCEEKMVEETETGTWEHGLSRLLLGLTTVVRSPETFSAKTLPYDAIDFSQGELLAKWIQLLYSLRDDLAPLHDGSQLSMEDWVNYMICLLENYFQPDFEETESVDQYEDLKKQFEILRSSAKTYPEAFFSFASIKTHLMGLLQQRGITYRENHVQSVRFCSMLPLRSIPAKVIALMGMQEGAFPRSGSHSSLNLMFGQAHLDYCPNHLDYDRYLFLEALQSAQDYLLLSYLGYNHHDGKELQPSLVIEELFSYLNKYYTIQGKKVAETCHYRHPFDPFNEAYFQPHSPLMSFSLKDYQAACLYYGKKKQAPHTFIETFSLVPPPPPSSPKEHPVTLDLKRLVAVARNPIKFHLNQTLEIYLQNDEDRLLKNEEELFLSALDKYKLKQSAMKHPLDRVLLRAEKEGKLPLGLFKMVASKRVTEEVQEWQLRLDKHQINPKEIFEVEFSTDCQHPTQLREDYWLYPSLCVTTESSQKVYITGKLSQVTPKGLLAMSRGQLAEAWKMWPQFLLFQYVTQLHPQPIEPQLILAYASKPKRAFFDQPHSYLKQFLDYYDRCIAGFSPLLPDWIPLILEGNSKGIYDKMRQLFGGTFRFSDYQSPDLKWALNKEQLPDAEQLIAEWRDYTQMLVGDLMQHWYQGKENLEGAE